MSDVLPRFESVLRFASTRGISDVHIKPNQRPIYRRLGGLISRKDEPTFNELELDEVTRSLAPPALQARWLAGAEVTFAYGLVGCGRFRVSLLRQRGSTGVAVRVVPAKVATLRELNLPKVIGNWCTQPGGLIVVTGGSGSGRSATWAALVEHVNTASTGPRHVVTLEDPIEALFDDKMAFIRQREVGVDCATLAAGLRTVARQDADVVAVGDLPPEVALDAIALAEDGRLVIAGMVGGSPVEALRRMLDAAGPQRDSLRARLARRLRGVVAQQLVTSADGKTRMPATEVLAVTPTVADFLRGGTELDALHGLMEQGRALGMHTLDQSLLELVQSGQASLDMAMAVARRPDELRDRVSTIRVPSQVAPDDRLF